MVIQITRAMPEHVEQIARIIFEAFKGIHDHHQFPRDVPAPQVAGMMAGMLVNRPDFYGAVAVLEGKIVGSNFAQLCDAVSGIGPITVDPACQARGVGRELMQHVVDWSLKNHGPMVRLLQDSFNMTSLSLCASLGFTVVEPLALMEVPVADASDASVRPLTSGDLPECETLCMSIQKVSRKNELAFAVQHGAAHDATPMGRFTEGKLTAYVIPGFFGHGVGKTADDLLATAMQAARHSPPPMHKLFVPVRQGEMFRMALARKFRSIKMMTLMVMGPYDSPDQQAAWAPSIAY